MTRSLIPIFLLLVACGGNDAGRGDGTTNSGTAPTENATDPSNAESRDNNDPRQLGDTLQTPPPREDMARP